ncbi:hypothetical protein ACFQE1_07975 [Halobium palmae]|uniref:Small CPxCG-related zinc finger protein n=1 Tax=Halobium palmae TaxID=1776492 RepID=A0ABD5RYC3_9EURY
MSHQPRLPERYVCTDCLVVSAGRRGEGDDQRRPPESCGACGASAFVEIEQFHE